MTMKFQYNEDTYFIRFSYSPPFNTLSTEIRLHLGKDCPTRATTCTILRANKKDPRGLDVLSSATARTDSRDIFVKAEGRKHTLTKALRALVDFNRDFRTAAWNCYNTNTRRQHV